VLVVLAVVVLVRARSRFGWFALGTAAPFAALGWYQWRAFGAPWHTPAAYYAGTINGTSRGGYTVPNVHDVVSVLFGNRGVLVGAPIALVALAAAAWLVVNGRDDVRRHAVVALAVTVPYLVLCAGWSGLPLLEEPGPRYLIPALPFLVVPLAVMWDRLWQPALLAGVLGAIVSVPATFTFILLGIDQPPYHALWQRVADRRFLPTVWSMAFGRAGVALYLAGAAVAFAVVARAVRTGPEVVVPDRVEARTDVRATCPEPLR